MHKRCIACQERLVDKLRWKELFFLEGMRGGSIYPLKDWICASCAEQMECLSDPCAFCHRSLCTLPAAYIHEHRDRQICYDCYRWTQWQGYSERLLGNISCIAYNDWAKEHIGQYKFRLDERYKYFYASLLFEYWQEAHDSLSTSRQILSPQQTDMLVPIPLAEERQRERGFNQSARIAQILGQALAIPCEQHCLSRRSDDPKQSKKGREDRLTHLLQKFIKQMHQCADIHNKNIVLIDDIYTTGATVHAAAHTLINAGAHRVMSLTIAR